MTAYLLVAVGLGALLLWSGSASAASSPSGPDWPPSAATQQDLLNQARSAMMATFGRGLTDAEEQTISSAAQEWPSQYATECAARGVRPTTAEYRVWTSTQLALLEMWLGQMQGGAGLPGFGTTVVSGWYR